MHRSPASGTSKLKHFDLYGKVGCWGGGVNMPSVSNGWANWG